MIARVLAAAAAAAVVLAPLAAQAAPAHHHHARSFAPLAGIFDPLIPRSAAYTARMDGLLHPDLVQVYEPLWAAPPLRQMEANHADGAMTVLDVDPYAVIKIPGMDHPSVASAFSVAARDIASGKLDSYLAWYADRLRDLRFPVALSFAHEANGNWYPWGSGQTRPRMLVRAWRHLHDVFDDQGARNVIWVWTINKLYPWDGGEAKMARITREDWPGRKYVNYVGIDSYFRRPSQRFYDRVVPTLRFVRRLTAKPVLITETGVSPSPQEYAQLRSLVSGVIRWHLLGFLYFNLDMLEQWALTPGEARLLGRLLRADRYAMATAGGKW